MKMILKWAVYIISIIFLLNATYNFSQAQMSLFSFIMFLTILPIAIIFSLSKKPNINIISDETFRKHNKKIKGVYLLLGLIFLWAMINPKYTGLPFSEESIFKIFLVLIVFLFYIFIFLIPKSNWHRD